MEEEINLSEMIFTDRMGIDVIVKDNVKEFIKIITSDIYVPEGSTTEIELIKRIKKHSGEKLLSHNID